MDHFPIFLATADQRIVVAGGGEAALAKLRLLLKTRAHIDVFARNVDPAIIELAETGHITLHPRPLKVGDTSGAALFYAASEDEAEDARSASIARAEGALVNIVDNLADSAFITPAIVDRDPVTIAIGTEGAAPVLARAIKADLEERLPASLGLMARVGKAFRKAADALPMGRMRRDFWRDYYFRSGPRAVTGGEDSLHQALEAGLQSHLNKAPKQGHVAFVGGGPGDPELLTLKARKALDEADVVIYDRLISKEILELARREALMIDVGKQGFAPSTAQDEINRLIVEHSQNGQQVVRLKGGDATVFGRLDEEIEALETAGIAFSIIPGITAASAAVASIGQSLTQRGRNSSVRLMTGHDVKGFADHDWSVLARPDEVAAIYMGKRAARFLQGRLLMHGADRATPITLIENASRLDQRVVESSLETLAKDIEAAAFSGPVLTLFGLAPREATTVQNALPQQEFA